MVTAHAKWLYALLPFLLWLPILNRDVVKADIFAGITAGVLVLPQAIALASLAGMPPEYGLYTSIFPVLFAALFGSSWHAMSGPNTALSILVAFTIAPYASIGSPEWIQYAITLAFMAGIIQVTFGILRLGIVFNYFSKTVTVALITGVGVIIIVSQLGNFMGVLMNIAEPIENVIPQIFYSVLRANGFAVLVGTVTLLSGLFVKRYYPKLPFLIVAVIAGMVCSAVLELFFGTARVGLDKLGTMSLSVLPLSAPDFSPENFTEAAQGLLPAAFVIAFLGLIQASVIARAMASKSGQYVDINQEVLGQGVSNLAGSFLSCFPSCSSFNRSASNFESGGRTPLSALVSVITLAILVIFATPLIAQMPITVMAAILLLVGAGLIKKNDIKKIFKMKGESRIIFVIILGTTVYGGVDYAVFAGIGLSIIAYLRSVSKPEIELLTGKAAQQYCRRFDDALPLPGAIMVATSGHHFSSVAQQAVDREQSLLRGEQRHANVSIAKQFGHITVLKVSGSLFFGSVFRLEKMLTKLRRQDGGEGDLIISGENLHSADSTGAEVLMHEVQGRMNAGARVQLWLRNHDHDAVFRASGLLKVLGTENIYYLDPVGTGTDKIKS
ncbi:MAG: SulP family inorganic anion transporter [Gammaproteobacteria bacterium]|nr:SulP family inorganic anion transporter [Gammaproteobacteria bacterium]